MSEFSVTALAPPAICVPCKISNIRNLKAGPILDKPQHPIVLYTQDSNLWSCLLAFDRLSCFVLQAISILHSASQLLLYCFQSSGLSNTSQCNDMADCTIVPSMNVKTCHLLYVNPIAPAFPSLPVLAIHPTSHACQYTTLTWHTLERHAPKLSTSLSQWSASNVDRRYWLKRCTDVAHCRGCDCWSLAYAYSANASSRMLYIARGQPEYSP